MSEGNLFRRVRFRLPSTSVEEIEPELERLVLEGLVRKQTTDTSIITTVSKEDFYSYRISPEGASLASRIDLGGYVPVFVETPRPGIIDEYPKTQNGAKDGVQVPPLGGDVISEKGQSAIDLNAKIQSDMVQKYNEISDQMAQMKKQIDSHEKAIDSFFTKTIELFGAFVGIFSFIVVFLNSAIPNLPSSGSLENLVGYCAIVVIMFVVTFLSFFLILNRYVIGPRKK